MRKYIVEFGMIFLSALSALGWVYNKGRKDAEEKIEQERQEQLLSDLKIKEQVHKDAAEDIANSSINERVNKLLRQSDEDA